MKLSVGQYYLKPYGLRKECHSKQTSEYFWQYNVLANTGKHISLILICDMMPAQVEYWWMQSMWSYHSSSGFSEGGTGDELSCSSSSFSFWASVSLFLSIIFWVKSTRNSPSVSSSDELHNKVNTKYAHFDAVVADIRHKQFTNQESLL